MDVNTLQQARADCQGGVGRGCESWVILVKCACEQSRTTAEEREEERVEKGGGVGVAL